MPEHIFDTDTLNAETLFDVSGKVALVTGGSRGIGLMIAQGFVQRGVKVYITARNAEVCNAVAAELSEIGECISLPENLATPDGCKALAAELKKREDKLHMLVNNAGASWGQNFDEYSDDGFKKVMDLNVNSIFTLTRELAGLLQAAGTPADPARVMNIGSMDAMHVNRLTQTGTFAYAASKAAVHHLTRHLAVDLAPRNINTNTIAPGFFESKMTEYVLGNFQETIESKCPQSRIGKPEEMAGVAIYLASRAGAYTNGAEIVVDGATHLA